MSDINLLPNDLRAKEQEEQIKKVPTPAPKYTKSPSLLGERIMEAGQVKKPWWNKVASWFNKIPEPVALTKVASDAQVTVEVEKDKFSWFKKLFSSNKQPEQIISPKPAAAPLKPGPIPVPEGVRKPAAPSLPSVPIGVVLDVNLLPVSSQPSPVMPYLKKLGWVAVAAVLVVGLIYGILLSLVSRQKVQGELVKRDANILVDQIKKSENNLKELEAVARQMDAIKKLIINRNDSIKLFAVFEKATLPEVSLSSLSASADGLVTVAATARTVTDLAKQLSSFENYDAIAEVAIGSISINDQSIAGAVEVRTNFQIRLKDNYLKNK